MIADNELIVDAFCGGGGASEGIRRATGRCPDIAINHDEEAIIMHEANHPETLHLRESIWTVSPAKVTKGAPVGLLWASPDCTHFSRAKGAKPVSRRRRSLANVIVKWARDVSPRIICVENVPEFVTWGPLNADSLPNKAQAGKYFRAWVRSLERLGYAVEHRELVAADYGAPTTRKRLFIVARRDGQPIEWPAKTHGKGAPLPWQPVAACIDWSTPCPSIFGRKRPLAEATLRRIARGIVKYVLNDPNPFVVGMETSLASPIIAGCGGRAGQTEPRPGSAPGYTTTKKADTAVAVAHLLKHYGGVTGQDARSPAGTITSTDHHSLTVAHGIKISGDAGYGAHAGVVAAFLQEYYGNGNPLSAENPIPTIVTKDRVAVVTVKIKGESYVISDIGMRMLQPRELARAQGFQDEYVLTGSKTSQVAKIGNSVVPHCAEALVRANLGIGPVHVEDQQNLLRKAA